MRRFEFRAKRRLAVACVAGLIADVDEFVAQLADGVVGLREVGECHVELLPHGVEGCLLLDDRGLRADRHLLGCLPTFLGSLQRSPQIGVALLGRADGEQFADLILPAGRPLQPQDPDRIDELGHRTDGDPLAERVVGLDDTTEPAQRPRRNPGDAELRPEFLGERQ